MDKFDELTLGPSTPPNTEEHPSIDSQLENGEADEETTLQHRAIMTAARYTSGQETSLHKLRIHFHKVIDSITLPQVFNHLSKPSWMEVLGVYEVQLP